LKVLLLKPKDLQSPHERQEPSSTRRNRDFSTSFSVTTPARRSPSVKRRPLEPVWFINDSALTASVPGLIEFSPEQGIAISRTCF
jgi:hypothetical protein